MMKKEFKEKEIRMLIRDLQSISVRNPSNMTWRQIGEALHSMGWKKTFAEREEYTVTEDDVETAFLLLSNFADELCDVVESEKVLVNKVYFALQHNQIYQLYWEFKRANEYGEYNEIWKKYQKKTGKEGDIPEEK